MRIWSSERIQEGHGIEMEIQKQGGFLEEVTQEQGSGECYFTDREPPALLRRCHILSPLFLGAFAPAWSSWQTLSSMPCWWATLESG